MSPREHFQEYVDAAYDAIWFADSEPDKAQEFLNKLKIHHESFVSSMQAKITAERYMSLSLLTP